MLDIYDHLLKTKGGLVQLLYECASLLLMQYFSLRIA